MRRYSGQSSGWKLVKSGSTFLFIRTCLKIEMYSIMLSYPRRRESRSCSRKKISLLVKSPRLSFRCEARNLRESRNEISPCGRDDNNNPGAKLGRWIPACAGMTNRDGYFTEMSETPDLKIFGSDFYMMQFEYLTLTINYGNMTI
jgi:hypothetical protein